MHAIRPNYRTSLRSSSIGKPRYPLPKFVIFSSSSSFASFRREKERARAFPLASAPVVLFVGVTSGVSFVDGFVPPARKGTNRTGFNDPSEGSPTETLLRLLLPLNCEIRTGFPRLLEGFPGVPPSGPGFSSSNSIGRSDGRCVQRAGTQSGQVDDLPLLGIPRSRAIVARHDPHHVALYELASPLRAR